MVESFYALATSVRHARWWMSGELMYIALVNKVTRGCSSRYRSHGRDTISNLTGGELLCQLGQARPYIRRDLESSCNSTIDFVGRSLNSVAG